MNTFLRSLFLQLKGFYQNQTPVKRMSILIVCVIAVTSVIIIGVMISGRSYVPLFTSVPPEQLSIILNKLKEKNVKFEVRDDGKTVAVPPEMLHSLQMSIMTESSSNKMGEIGFELFDKQSFGVTSYAQKINYQRAVQGELMRAINTLDPVRNSKVILALPPKKTFLEEGGSPSASVVVDLYDGKNLTPEQVKGITLLVANAIENMDSDRVTVVDSRGKVLSKNKGDPSIGLTNDIVELKLKTEEQLEHRIESMLERIVGSGKVMARVDAALNAQLVTSVEEQIDPDKTAIRSVVSEEESMNGTRRNPTGVPGARSNLPGAEDQGQVSFGQDVKKDLKTTNYEVPKTVRNVRENPGKIDRITVAVVVDGIRTVTKKEDGTTEEKWDRRSAEELAQYETIVKNAVGFKAERGDVVKIENIKFEKEDFSESEQILSQLEKRKLLNYLLRWSVIGLAMILFFFLVVRPFMRWVTESFQESIDDMLPKTIEELEEIQGIDGGLPGMSSALPILEEALDPDKAESELLKEKIMTIVEQNQRKASNALGLWLVKKE
ncbi:MAG: flagellar basal-body MS-ring/collar protein FliF [Bdellovibrionales bacterium]